MLSRNKETFSPLKLTTYMFKLMFRFLIFTKNVTTIIHQSITNSKVCHPYCRDIVLNSFKIVKRKCIVLKYGEEKISLGQDPFGSLSTQLIQ